jgi:hypothetical protein
MYTQLVKYGEQNTCADLHSRRRSNQLQMGL